MLPLRLTIQGLYSYKTLQSIDFQDLTKDHLFGIFGAVGSGKSSILDAITFALYGKLERMSSANAKKPNDFESKIRIAAGVEENVFNQESSKFLVDFEFELCKDRIYRFTVKNDRNKNGLPTGFKRAAYKFENNTWVPLNSDNGANIFNLSYENFRRTVIIPQGQFQEFLTLTGSERTVMMLELFPKLKAFDFGQKLAELLSKSKENLNIIEGQYIELKAVEGFDLEASKNEIDLAGNQLKELKSELEIKQKDLQQANELKKLFEDLQKKKELIAELEIQKPQFDRKKENLDRYELILRKFDSDIKLWDRSKAELKEAEEQFIQTQSLEKSTSFALENESKKLKEFEAQAKLVPDWEHEIRDLNLFSEKLKLEIESTERKIILRSLESNLLELNSKKELISNQLKENKLKYQQGKAQQIDVVLLTKALQFFKENKRINKEKSDKSNALEKAKSRIQDLKTEKEQIMANSVCLRNSEIEAETKIKDILLFLETEKAKIETEKQQVQIQSEDLAKKEQLFQFSSQMIEGKPCPLCGSIHHPEIITAEDVGILKAQGKEKTANLNLVLKEIDATNKALLEISSELRSAVSLEATTSNELTIILNSLQNLLDEYAKNSFVLLGEDKVLEEQKLEIEIQRANAKLENAIKNLESDLDEIETKTKPEKEDLDIENQTIARIEGQISSKNDQLKNLENFASFSQIEIESRIANLNGLLKNATTNLETQKAKSHLAETAHTTAKAKLQTQEESLHLKQKAQHEMSAIIIKKIESEHLGTLEDIRNILSQNIQIETIRAEINKYFENLNVARSELKNLLTKTENHQFDESKWVELEESMKNMTAEIAEKDGTLAVLKAKLLDTESRLLKLDKLISEKSKLEERQTNLKLIEGLFRGNAFVNYVSSVYLRNVVEIANQRFFRLTRQKLRLELDVDNTFYVKDFLNNGHRRLAKTMSGGQIFQASLSLALALADTVRHLSQSESNFFFLDEGFGSLDKESLHLVFDTLRHLKHENRVVGVISHIEEMQQEIDNCLKIRMDAEKGSIIESVL